MASNATVNLQYTTSAIWPQFLFGQGWNTGKAVCFPKGINLLRLWDDGTRWALLNPANGVYDWTQLDNRIAAAQAAGVDLIYTFGSTPAWAAQTVDCSTVGNYDATSNRPPTIAAWTTFVNALVEHVKNPDGSLKIKYFEAQNEFNSLGFWCGTIEQLLEQQTVLYAVVHPTGAYVTTPTPCMDTTTIDAALDTLLSSGFQSGLNFDIVTCHGYFPDNGTSGTAIGPTFDNFKAVMLKYGLTNPIWDTEYGPVSTTAISDAVMEQFVADSLAIHMSKGFQAACWYLWDDPSTMHYGRPMVDLSGILNAAGNTWMQWWNYFHPA